MPRQTSVQLTEATERQVAVLQEQGFGTFTDIVRLAIDRMYREETSMELTEDQMSCAIGARVVDSAPDENWAWGDPEWDKTFDERVSKGREILKHYSLSFSERFTVLPPEVPEETVAWLKTDAGYIATSPAYRMAWFRKRPNDQEA